MITALPADGPHDSQPAPGSDPLESWQSRFNGVARWLDRHQPPEEGILLGTALLVGLGTGLGSVLFRFLLEWIHTFAFETLPHYLAALPSAWYFLLLPALGGLLVGPITYFFAREAKGHGVPEVMAAIALRGGRIRPIVALVKALASAITLGTGGSAGQEGPIVQIGSALGSTVGQVMHLSDERIRNLVACGAASGIAAIFNAPIAGVLFALEVILGEFSVGYLSTVVLAAVTSSIVGRTFFGDVSAFRVPSYNLVSGWELPLYAILGAIAAGAAVFYIVVLYGFEEVFEKWRFPDYLKPAIGGIGVGIIGLLAPEVFGGGYETIGQVLHNQIVVSTMLLLLVGKLLATCFTLGSGGSGGVFAPGLFMGAVLGGEYGFLVNRLFPGFTGPPGAYALVGMSALFAASAHAPLTAIIMLFEMTGDYQIILPLMLATVLSTFLAQRLKSQSIYTEKLKRKGIHLQRGRDIDVMQSVRVEEVMSRDVYPVPLTMPLDELGVTFAETHRHGFSVLDEQGDLVGVVTLQDLERVVTAQEIRNKTVADIVSTPPVVVYEDETVEVALNRMAPRDLSRLPVVARDNPKKLQGIVRRRDIVRAYNVAILRRHEFQQRAAQQRLESTPDARFLQYAIDADSPIVGKQVRELALPSACVLVSVRRHRELLIPHGNTVIEPGDRLTALVRRGSEEALQQVLGKPQ